MYIWTSARDPCGPLEARARDAFAATWDVAATAEAAPRARHAAAEAQARFAALLAERAESDRQAAPGRALADQLHEALLELELAAALGPEDARGRAAARRARVAVGRDGRALLRAVLELGARPEPR